MTPLDIEPPIRQRSDPDYAMEREEAIELAFQNVAMRAERAGWQPEVVAKALLALGANNMKGLMADQAVEAAVEAAVTAPSIA